MRIHGFVGEGDRCRLLIGDGARFCGHEPTNPIHAVDPDPREAMERQLGQRRDACDIEIGNPRLVDPGGA
jgi:hypothetical protein